MLSKKESKRGVFYAGKEKAQSKNLLFCREYLGMGKRGKSPRQSQEVPEPKDAVRRGKNNNADKGGEKGS